VTDAQEVFSNTSTKIVLSDERVGAKLAETAVAAETVTVQGPVPVQPPPLQPAKTELTLGVAASTTTAPLAKLAVQVAPQLMSPGVPVTVPLPSPLRPTASVKVGAKVAVTVVAAETVTVQGPVPVQPPPLQPAKTEPVLGVAVSTTTVPLVKLAVQLAPQLMSPGVPVTVPVPSPLRATVSVKIGVKLAVTVVAAESVTVQGPVPVQPPPLQPTKTELAPGVAVSTTIVPLVKLAVQVAPQLMSPGVPVTVPVPSPLRPTVSVKIGVKVTAKLAVALLLAASRAVTVSVLVPACSAIPLAVQFVVPLAVPPPPPRLFAHVTSVTPPLSDAVPSSVRSGAVVL